MRHAPQEACRDLDTHSLVQRGKKRLGSLLTEVPADEQADFAQGGGDGGVRRESGGVQVRAFGVPEVFLGVLPQDGARGGDEVGRVVQFLLVGV